MEQSIYPSLEKVSQAIEDHRSNRNKGCYVTTDENTKHLAQSVFADGDDIYANTPVGQKKIRSAEVYD